MGDDLQERDRQIYERELRGFLPARIFDAHVHFFDASCLVPGATFPPRHCYHKFGGTFTPSQYETWAAQALPGAEIHLNSFGHPGNESDRDASAVYTGSIADNRRSHGMALVAPGDSAETVRRRVQQNQLIGFKPYPDFVPGKPVAEVTVHDMLPAAQMAVADQLGLAIMLHIPRPGRLADPVNQAQMVELCERYPNARIILAHIGRAYWMSTVTDSLDGIASCPNAYIDTAMVNHEGVLEYAFNNFPRERILFGSDAPIACLRGRSIEKNDNYAYMMAEDYEIGSSIYDPEHAAEYTSFYYEQLHGIKLAAEKACLSRDEVEGVLFGNASRLFSLVASRWSQVQEKQGQ